MRTVRAYLPLFQGVMFHVPWVPEPQSHTMLNIVSKVFYYALNDYYSRKHTETSIFFVFNKCVLIFHKKMGVLRTWHKLFLVDRDFPHG